MEKWGFTKYVLLIMKLTKEVLAKLEITYKNIDYYYSIIDVIETKVEVAPDISIESCKSLIEGISKFTLRQLDIKYNSSEVDGLDFHKLFKRSISNLAIHCEDIESDFVLRSNSLIHLIGEIRNRRGDISHGKLAPKEISSDFLFSTLVMQMTDCLVYYILNCFSKIEMQKKIEYEDNQEFNEWLDESNQFGLLKSYSKALFEQDEVAYEQELLNYLDLQETKNGETT